MFLKGIVSCVSMRKKIVWCVVLAAVLAACDRKKAVPETGWTNDSITDFLTESPDSFFSTATAEEELSDRADELFDDFIFDFARLRKVQSERVSFPLLSVVRGDTVWIMREQWTHEPLFMDQDYYTVFYNNEEQMELEKRTDLNRVDVEQILLADRVVRTCCFERLDGEWMLTRETERDFLPSEPLDAFMDFYQQFVTDSDFQQRRVADPLRYITTDLEDDFGTVEGTLDNEQWNAFKPHLPSGVITNIRYGQTYDDPRNMIMVKAGISNGLMDIFDFGKKNGKWMLVSYEN